jgi:glucan phosphoethanolaminetransferase (alkaline phosphatase superfamily)
MLLLKRWVPKWLFYSFIGFSFAVLLAHFADFTIARLMDASISYIFYHFFGSGISHLVPAFQSLNLNGTMVMLIVGGILLIPFIGIAFYCATDTLSKFIPWKLSMARLIVSLLAIGTSLFVLDLLFHPFLHRTLYAKYQKALPLGTTFMHPTPTCISLKSPIKNARDEAQTQKWLEEKKLLAASKPNIFLFVIETLRKDFITESIAPELTRFGKENISFKESFSNANSTHPSWFAIFHADFPYHWTTMRDHWKKGSIPLRILKDLGYKISVFSSADLKYFQIDQLLFGKNRELCDHLEEYTEIRFIEPCDRDRMGLESLFTQLEKEESSSGNVFIVFFDSTHSEYSFPADFPLKFTPIAKEIDYLTLTYESVEPLKNRYRNSISYIDSLLGRFFAKLKEKNLYSQSIIAITGDHGEEFFEEGAIFHGTHLNRYQTSVPLFYKLQTNPWIPLDSCTTHLDIFPSIIHYLTGRSDFGDLFDGQSIFAPHRLPYHIAVLNNGSHVPIEFSLENSSEKYHFRFSNIYNIYESDRLEVIFPLGSPLIEEVLLAPLLK